MIKAIKFVILEHIHNIGQIWYLARYETKKQTIRTSLGLGWVFVRDLVYFTIYSVFFYLMIGGGYVEGVHYVPYLLVGLIAWFFIFDTITGGVQAFRKHQHIINSIHFPLSILPTIEVIAVFLRRLFTLIIAFIITIAFGYFNKIDIFLFLYYFFAMFYFLVSYNLVVSALIAISEDFNQLYTTITSIFFFLVPIMWNFEYIHHIPHAVQIAKLNPMVYIIVGFRDSFLVGNPPAPLFTLYFWIACTALFCLGSFLQFRLQKYYSDFI